MRFNNTKIIYRALYLVSILLSACGGGGSDGVGIDNHSGTVFAYAIGAGGALTPIGSVAAGTGPGFVTVDPSGRFAYVANHGSDTVSQYNIGTSGVLTPMTPATVAAGMGPSFVTVDPSGQFAYVANWGSDIVPDGTVSAYAINAGTGALTQINCISTCNGNNFPAGLKSYSVSVTVTPTGGKFAYVANWGSGDVSAYSIDANGVLTEVSNSPFVAGTSSASVTVDPSGKFAYVANAGSGDVSAYSIDASTGELIEVIGSPFTAGMNPASVTVDPSGKFVYVANFNFNNIPNSNDVSAYTIEVNGALTRIDADSVAVGIQNFPAGTNPSFVSVDPSGKFAYVTNYGSNNVSAYAVEVNGALTQIDADSVAVGIQNFPAGTNPSSVTVDPSGKFAYVASRL